MTARLLFALCFGLCATAACSDDGTFFFDAGADSGTSDTGGDTSTGTDTGATDTGETDAGGMDGGSMDTGGEPDTMDDVRPADTGGEPDAMDDVGGDDVGGDAIGDADFDGGWDGGFDADFDAFEDAGDDATAPEPGAPCFTDDDCAAGLTCAGGPECDGVYACVETSSCGLSPSFAMCGCDATVRIGQVTCTTGAVVSTDRIGGDPGATCDPDGDDAEHYDVAVFDGSFDAPDGTPVRARFAQATLEGGVLEAFELVRDGGIRITVFNALGRDLFGAFGGVLIDLDNDGECDEGETVYNIFANNPFTEDDEVVIDLDTGAGPGEPGTCEDWDLLTE